MSFKAVFQFILLIHDFKNVDLPNEGLIAISASIYKQQKNRQITVAFPYEYPYQRNYKISKKRIREGSSVEDMFFRSKVVLIKYADQLVNIDDFVQFRLELEAFPYLDTDNVFLELTLLFSGRYYSSEGDKFNGKPVSQVKMRLKVIKNGIFCYSEADFKQEYFSKCSFTLYGQLMHYKFQKYQIKSKQPSSRQIARSKIDNFGKLLIWSKQNYLQAGQDPFDLFYSNYVKDLRHSNYLTQTKLNNCSLIKQKLVIKVSKKFLESINLSSSTQIDQKIFREYLQSYKQPLSLDQIPQQIHEIRIDNFQFLNHVIQQMFHDQFDTQKMKLQYISYIKEKLGERVFKNTLYGQDLNLQNALNQNKKIARQMRSKKFELTEYPIENQILISNRDEHEFIFYELTLPQCLKEGFKHIMKQRKDYVSNQRQISSVWRGTDINSSKDSCNNQGQGLLVDWKQPQNDKYKSNTYSNSQQFFIESKFHLNRLQYQQKNMLIVMCHGFQGNSYDMVLIHKSIKAQLPNACYILSRRNQEDTQGDIQRMGQKLADQVKCYIKTFMSQQSVIINFVGHSMGGIIARASLKHLVQYKYQFGFYCSLSSPHLGYLNGVDNKIKAGLWVLRKWKPVKSLDQLSMEQAKDPRKTFMYKLSKTGTLQLFRKIILFSSFEDSYVPWHSARVSRHSSKNHQSKIQNQMAQNILGLGYGKNMDTTVHRLDVNFNVKRNDIDSLIGRAAHINLIIQESLFDVINTTLPDLFNLKEYGTGLVQLKGGNQGSQKIVRKYSQPNTKARFKEGTLTKPVA